MKRRFVVLMPFDVFRSDVSQVKRIVVSALFTSHDIRRDVVLVFLLHDIDVKVTVLGEKAKHVHVDEASYMGIHRRILSAVEEVKAGGQKKFPHWGFTVEKAKGDARDLQGYLVSTRGRDILEVLRSGIEDITLVFSEKRDLHGLESVRISRGKKPVDVLIALANIWIDNYA